MKKVLIFSFLISTFLIFASCGTTKNVSQATQEPKNPQTAEEVISTAQQEVADALANELNSTFPDSQVPEAAHHDQCGV